MPTPKNISMGAEVSFGAYPTRTWRADPATGRLSGFTDGLEAMRQAVEIALNVRRFHWQIYSPNVGHELEILGMDYDTARVRLRAQIEAALSADSRIKSVEDYRFSREGDVMTAAFTVRTVFGDLQTEVGV